MASERFQIRIDPWWAPPLFLGGATRDTSFVEVDDEAVRVRFGWLLSATIPRANVEGAAAIEWPWWRGLGWRVGLGEPVGLTGSYSGVVELRLKEPLRVWGLVRYRRLAISLERPEEFVNSFAPSPPPKPRPRPAARAKT